MSQMIPAIFGNSIMQTLTNINGFEVGLLSDWGLNHP